MIWLLLAWVVVLTICVAIGAHFVWDTRRQHRNFVSGRSNGEETEKMRVPGTRRWLMDAHDYVNLREHDMKAQARIDQLESVVKKKIGELPSLFHFEDARKVELRREFGIDE